MYEHGENIAELLSESELSSIAADLLAGIEEDERSRQELLSDLVRGLDILAVKLEQPRSDAGRRRRRFPIAHPCGRRATRSPGR